MATATTATVRDPAKLRTIDVDVHNQITDWRAIAPHAPEGLRHRVARQSGPPLARHGFRPVGARFGDAPRPPAG
nr:hypothetical protein [Chloroflexota bacterium]